MEYKSPHKLRQGHEMSALTHCNTINELKCVSQNVIHRSLGITDSVDGKRMDNDEKMRVEKNLKIREGKTPALVLAHPK